MKKYIFTMFILFGIGSLFFVKKIFFKKINSSISNLQGADIKKCFNVAILKPISHPAIDDIENSFITFLNEKISVSYNFSSYNANGNRVLMRSQSEEIVSSDYDLVFTIGANASQTINEVIKKKKKDIPLVFTAVNNPESLGLINHNKEGSCSVTGVTESVNYKKQIDLFLKLKPNTKDVLLVYNPSEGSGLESDKDIVKQVFDANGVSLTVMEVYQSNEIFTKVSSVIFNFDSLIVLKDNTVVSAIDGLVKLCNRYGVTLVASDLDSGQKGAVFSFGVQESDFGVKAAEMVSQRLSDGIACKSIPITNLSNYKLCINKKNMEKQNLILNTRDMFLIENGQVI